VQGEVRGRTEEERGEERRERNTEWDRAGRNIIFLSSLSPPGTVTLSSAHRLKANCARFFSIVISS